MKFNPLKKLSDAKKSVSETARSIGDNSNSLQEFSDNACSLIDMLKKFLRKDNDTVELKNLQNGTVGKLFHNNELYDNVNNVLTDLRKLVNNINDNPEKFNINLSLDKNIVDNIEKKTK